MSSTDCTDVYIALNIAFSILCGLSLLTLGFTSCIIMQHKTENKLSPKMNILRVLFIICTVIIIAYYPMLRWDNCYFNNYSFTEPALTTWYCLTGIQAIILSILFFTKVCAIFQKTSYRMTKCTLRTYRVVFTFCILYVIIGGVLIYMDHSEEFIAAGLLLIYILIMISLTILFIGKLIVVYKTTLSMEDTEVNADLMNAITKITVLMLISLSATLMNIVINMIHAQVLFHSEIFQFIASVVGLGDIYTNFITTILCYNEFTDYYKTLCSCVDSICRVCWMRIVVGKDVDNAKIKSTSEMADVDTAGKTETIQHETQLHIQLSK